MEQEYLDFFKYMNEIKEKQSRQKQRGLNEYNLLTSVLSIHDEVRLHSRVIKSLLDVNGKHFQDTLFLDEFLKVINIDDFSFNTSKARIHNEYENIDIYITDDNNHIIIENKIHAGDQEDQIKRYIDTIKSNNEDLEPENILVIYLSIDREKPSKYSLGDLKIDEKYIKNGNEYIALFININYKKEIIKWLKNSLNEVQNIINLSESIKQYKTVVEKITKTYKEKAVSLADEIVKDEEHVKKCFEIYKAFSEIKKAKMDKFFEEVKSLLKTELTKFKQNWIFQEHGDISRKNTYSYIFFKENWETDNCLLIVFEFDRADYFYGYTGIKEFDENMDMDNLTKKFSNETNKYKGLVENLKSSKWSLLYRYIDNKNHDLFDKIINENYKPENLVDELMKFIEAEEKTGLLDEIYKYLNSSKKKISKQKADK